MWSGAHPMIHHLHNFTDVMLKYLLNLFSRFQDGKYFSFIADAVALVIL